jgi:hypothetical protein
VGGQALLDGVGAERGAAAGREHRVGGRAGAFGLPGVQDGGDAGGQRGDPLFSAFAEAADVGAGAEVDVGQGQGGQLRDAQAGVDRQRHQGVVASSGPGGLVAGGEQRVGLGLGEVGDEGLMPLWMSSGGG